MENDTSGTAAGCETVVGEMWGVCAGVCGLWLRRLRSRREMMLQSLRETESGKNASTNVRNGDPGITHIVSILVTG